MKKSFVMVLGIAALGLSVSHGADTGIVPKPPAGSDLSKLKPKEFVVHYRLREWKTKHFGEAQAEAWAFAHKLYGMGFQTRITTKSSGTSTYSVSYLCPDGRERICNTWKEAFVFRNRVLPPDAESWIVTR